MSNKTKNCDERNMELLNLYTQALNFAYNNHIPAAHQAAVQIALRMGHPRIKVSFNRAYVIVSSLILHGRFIVNGEKRQRFWKEIADMVNFIITEFPQISIAKALDFVLETGRSSGFFITERRANLCICRAKAIRTRQLVANARRHVS